LLLDLDHFKRLNDTFGHQAGDDCLRAVAATVVKSAGGGQNFVARYGGEEFAVILPKTEMAEAMAKAERIRGAVEHLRIPLSASVGQQGRLTVSIGVATAVSRVGGRMSMPEGLVMAADRALYQATSEGRNRVTSALIVAPDESAPSRPYAA